MENNTELSVSQIVEREGSGKKRKRWVLAGLIVILLIAAAAFFFVRHRQSGGPDKLDFKTDKVTRGDLVISVTATGNLEATNQVDVGSELSGRIIKMTADFNDTVTKGQPLVYLDDSKYRANVAQSKSGVATAKANHSEALATLNAAEKTVKRYKRTRELTNNKLPSLEDLEEAEANYERAVASVAAAKAAIQSAQASLESDEADLKKTIIYSPINGVVLDRSVEVGQTVAASLEAPTVYTLAEDLRNMELVVDVDEADVGQVKEGQNATFTVDAYPERTFAAKITQVRYGADENDGVITYETVLKVDNPDLSLRPGMTATADITVEKYEDTLLIPNAALRFSPPRPSDGPPGNVQSDKKGFLSSILPGPSRRRFKRPDKKLGEHPQREKGRAMVWVLRDGQPAPVRIVKKATDGAMTAIASDQLTTDSLVITATLTKSK